MSRQRRTYTDEEIATALVTLRANRGNAKKTATQLGISRTTLRQWAGLSPVKGKQVEPAKVTAKGEQLAQKLDAIADTLAERLAEAARTVPLETAADLRNAAISQGITIEKASFARGGPTQRTESLRVSLVDPDELAKASLRVIEGGKRTKKDPSEGVA